MGVKRMSRNPAWLVIASRHPSEAIPVPVKEVFFHHRVTEDTEEDFKPGGKKQFLEKRPCYH